MRVLFVSSGAKSGLVSFIKVQGESLRQRGHKLDFHLVQKGGLRGYLSAIKELRRRIKEENIDIIHAHYSLVGGVALMAARGTGVPVLCSFMGSDIHGAINLKNRVKVSSYPVILISILIQPFLSHIIVKSESLTRKLISRKLPYTVIPNGVNTEMFKPLNQKECRETLGLPIDKKIWMFAGNPKVTIKNYPLFKSIGEQLIDEDNIFIAPYPVPHDKMNLYFNAVDALLLCSFAEGSPNAVKECMSSNTPVISTPVGDVDYLFSRKPKGYFIADFNPESFVKCIEQLNSIKAEPEGRKAIFDLGLEDQIIARKLEDIYRDLLNR